MKTRNPIAKIVGVCIGVGALVAGNAATAESAVTITVSDNAMLLDMSPLRIDTAAHLRQVRDSLRSATVVRPSKSEVPKLALADARSRG